MSIRPTAAGIALNVLLRGAYQPPITSVYLALYKGDPIGVPVGAEVIGGSYARQTITFTDPGSTSTTANASTVTFPTSSADWGKVTHWAIFDASSGGTMLFCDQFEHTRDITTGNSAKVVAGTITVKLNSEV